MSSGSASNTPRTPRTPRTRRRVVLAFYFFPHYRAPILRELLASPCHDYVLAGETRDCVDGSIAAWEPPASAEFVRTPFLRFHRTFGWMRGTLRLARRRDVDVVIFHANPYLISTWVGGVLARMAGKRVLFYTIGWFHHESRLRALVKRLYFAIPHGLLLYGHGAKVQGIRRGYPAERLYVVYNSMDYETQKAARADLTPDRLRQVRSSLFERGDRPMLVCTSRLTAKRRLDELLDAMTRLDREGHAVNLLLIGDGPERPRLERLAAERGLSVRFHGACYDEAELAPLIAAASATVAPGMVGLTALHSLAYGTPVITHDDPMHQSPEWEIIVPGRTGALFKRGDAGDLARVIREWTATELPDPAVRQRCHELLDRMYNPGFMRRVFDRAAGGEEADDLFWMKEGATEGRSGEVTK